jgi:CelD/BcsL family acetyltransferase involved in cellulose biosynthesis
VLVTSVTKDDKLVSACFSIKYKDTLHALLAGVDKRYLSLNPYSLMYWKLIEFACSNSLKCFDFGRSRIGTGSYNFKKNWGFPSTTLHYQYDLMKAREIPNLESGTTITKLFQLIWRMLPLGLVKWLGPKLRKYIVA